MIKVCAIGFWIQNLLLSVFTFDVANECSAGGGEGLWLYGGKTMSYRQSSVKSYHPIV